MIDFAVSISFNCCSYNLINTRDTTASSFFLKITEKIWLRSLEIYKNLGFSFSLKQTKQMHRTSIGWILCNLYEGVHFK